MDNSIIAESVELPSKGKLYDIKVNPNIEITSMTTNQEMKRLSHSERQNKLLCDIIDECIKGDMGISSYDLCLGDYQYLLHKLRIATYGSIYKSSTTCPYCYTVNESKLDLDTLKIKEYDDNILKYMEFNLPKCGKKIKLKLQTPHSIDDVNLRVKDFKKKNPGANIDPTLLYTVESLIDTVDGVVMDPITLDRWVRSLHMADTNYILGAADKIIENIGIDPSIIETCKGCGVDYPTSFRISPEFFRPSID